MSYSLEYYQNRDRYLMWRVEAHIARNLVGPAVEGMAVDLGLWIEGITSVEQSGFVVGRILTVGLCGVRRWPFFWRYQWLCDGVRLPNWPRLRWRGQTLSLSATKSN